MNASFKDKVVGEECKRGPYVHFIYHDNTGLIILEGKSKFLVEGKLPLIQLKRAPCPLSVNNEMIEADRDLTNAIDCSVLL